MCVITTALRVPAAGFDKSKKDQTTFFTAERANDSICDHSSHIFPKITDRWSIKKFAGCCVRVQLSGLIRFTLYMPFRPYPGSEADLLYGKSVKQSWLNGLYIFVALYFGEKDEKKL